MNLNVNTLLKKMWILYKGSIESNMKTTKSNVDLIKTWLNEIFINNFQVYFFKGKNLFICDIFYYRSN